MNAHHYKKMETRRAESHNCHLNFIAIMSLYPAGILITKKTIIHIINK